jgi:hypothetical protein
MNESALIELMESLKMFKEYTYFRQDFIFQFRELSSKEFMILYDIICKYHLKFEINHGLRIWLG